MTTRMTPHGEQEIDDFYEAPEAPIACRSCGSFEALPGGELCSACRHAVEAHGASFVDAYAVPCEGCDRPQIQTSPEAPVLCVNCHSPACEWPGECDDEAECVACGHYRHEHDADHSCKRFIFPTECNACGAVLKDGECPVCTAPLAAPEEILDILNDLIEWDAEMGCFENEVWTRARAIRDRLVVK